MASIIVLFASGDEQESETLKDLIQVKLGTSYDLTHIKGVLADERSLDEELSSCSCAILVSSKQSCEFIKNRDKEKGCGGIVIFDGELIHRHIVENSLLEKTVVVQLGTCGSSPEGVDQNKLFTLDGDLNSTNPKLDQIVDVIKGIVSSKVNQMKNNQGKNKKNCIQM